ncbi:flagellar motor switch protein FliN [Candidatus Kapabacteria bacterium]|nr:flagellar motor switch protein FliN [Candidatus Kapabacteria bacterium]
MTQEEIDALIQSGDLESEAEKQTAAGNIGKSEQEVSDADFSDIDKESDTIYSPLDPKLELLYDLQLPVSIELGRTNMLIRNILRLGRGSVIEFDKLVSEPVDVLINGKKVAEGEVVVIDKHFGIRITTLVDPTERLRGIK